MDPFTAVFIENIHHTLTFLDTRRDILSVATSVSKGWHTQCSDDKLWRLLFKRDWDATEKIIPMSPVFRVEQNIKLLGHASTFYQAYIMWEKLKARTRMSVNGGTSSRSSADVRKSFCRAASAWEKVFLFDTIHMPQLLSDHSQQQELHFPQLRIGKTQEQGMVQQLRGGLTHIHSSILAFFACVDGQLKLPASGSNNFEGHTAGQMGGFQVYGEYHCSILNTMEQCLELRNTLRLQTRKPDLFLLPLTSGTVMYQQTQMFRFICVEANTAEMFHLCFHISEPVSCTPMKRATNGSAILLLDWWEEFASRLTLNCYVPGKIFGKNHPGKIGIDLFPRIQPLMVACETNGIRVEASTIHFGDGRGWTYSIRLKLVDVQLLPGWSSEQQGFYGAQLMMRHWEIRDSSSAEVRRVDGPGVIGNFPVLHTGGYLDFGHENFTAEGMEVVDETGWFIYQSMSGNMSNLSTFGGRLTFVINRDGKDMSDSGRCENFSSMDSFDVVVPTFVLNRQEFYF